jgi:predicted RNA-binding protein with PIN domain
MAYLIDGDNLLGTWPGRRRSDAERRDLAFEIARFGRRKRRRMVVVFDGAVPPGAAAGPDVHYAGPGRSADAVILEFLRQEQDRRGWTVVTSDRSLGDQCRYMEARIERSDAFRKRLAASPAGEKPDREQDVDYWLGQFGEPE